MFKESRISIQDDRLSRSTVANTPEMVNSVNAIILVDSRVTVDDISEQSQIFVDTAHKIVLEELAFSKVSNRRVSLRQCKTLFCNKNMEIINQFGLEELKNSLYSSDLPTCFDLH